MNYNELITILGFLPKENTSGIYTKKYPKADNYAIEIDVEKEIINYGEKIQSESKTTQNFSQDENFVVLECVNRLLNTGYKPENIVLEPTWKLGHQEKGRLDILVKKDNKAYLMIECKTFGKEYDKELKNLHKDGGQLFSYFQQDKNAEILMLYTSQLKNGEIKKENTIVKIEEEYKSTSSVKDFYEKWGKQTKNYGVWENPPYGFKEKLLTKNDLKELTEEESKKIFHEFASILRKHSVSDKPNAFNKIFNLFLAKLYDEAKGEDDPLEFVYAETEHPVNFQVKLINLHRDGLLAFLEKEIEGIEDSDFNAKTDEELIEKKKKVLKFNNILTIKEVLDDESFDENQRVLKDVVKLLQKYRIRYPRKQQHLSDFFERLLTTGLKQEVGQYFTPPPITKFIVKSLPVKEMILQDANDKVAKLPAIIDYAVGSGHFLTEIMEEYQDTINEIDIESEIKYPIAKNEVASWQANPYNWAAKYVYGIDKDYRLVKVAKVGCYFYGDGVAQVIHGDGLDSFKTSKSYRGLLKENANKPQFSLVLSNPPYSVNDCKDDLEYIGAQNDFELYPYLTDKSKDIECLFVERTKHLLKDDGIAAIILPSSILNNTGIQTKTREIILQYFNIVAIVELGSNTFMATGTNTVTLFLKRKSNQDTVKLKTYTEKFFIEFIDNSIIEIEKPVTKYVNHVWENISFDDYVSLLKRQPNQNIQQHEIYKEYRKKIKSKTEKEFWDKLLEIEKNKLHYFLLAFFQRDIVLVKSGEKEAEKRFLGYYFSDRRGSEGMHSMEGGKTIDECTQLYNTNDQNDFTKASSYIYNAFLGNKNLEVAENLKSNVSYVDLLDMLTFDCAEFQKEIKLSVKKKVKIESKWEQILVNNSIQSVKGSVRKIEKFNIKEKGKNPVITQETTKLISGYSDEDNPISDLPIILFGDHSCSLKYVDFQFFRGADGTVLLKPQEKLNAKYYFYVLKNCILPLLPNQDKYERHYKYLQNAYIPLPPKEIQEKIVSEIEVLEKKEAEAKEKVEELKRNVNEIISKSEIYKKKKLGNLTTLITKGSSPNWQGVNYVESPEVLFVTSENVREGFLDLSTKKYLEKRFNEIQSRSILQRNDVLINIVGASIGRAAIFESSEIANINQAVALVRCNDVLNPKFLNYFLNTETAILMYDSMKSEVARANLSLQNISDLEIPVPPLPDQQKIVSQIEKIESEIAKLEEQLKDIPKAKEDVLKKYL